MGCAGLAGVAVVVLFGITGESLKSPKGLRVGAWPRSFLECDREDILQALHPEAAASLLCASFPDSVLALDHAEDYELLRTARTEISAALNELWQRGSPTIPSRRRLAVVCHRKLAK
jgi:hypothetical protein